MPVTPPAGDSDNHIAYYVRSTVRLYQNWCSVTLHESLFQLNNGL